MQALGLVDKSEKQNLVEISHSRISECKKWGLAERIMPPLGNK